MTALAEPVEQGRNRPCRCGSGRKAKRCCGATPAPIQTDRKPSWDDDAFGEFQRMLDRRARRATIHTEAFLKRKMAGRRLHHMDLWPASRHQAFETLFAHVYDDKPVPRDHGQPVWKQVAQRVTSPVYEDARSHTGHPARQTRSRKRAGWHRPDKDEQHVREIARRWREERIARKDKGDGDISGLLAIAAEIAATELQRAWPELAGDEHHRALTEWVYGCWGQMLHDFDPALPPIEFMTAPGYRAWRDRARLIAEAG